MRRDVVIVGAGPAGAVTALQLLARGIRPLLLELEEFPRYRIGESLTGACGAMLRRLGFEQRMADHAFPVKHGVRVHAPEDRASFYVPVRERGEDGALQCATTWQVRRSVFDRMLLDEAVRQGAELRYVDRCSPIVDADVVAGVRAVMRGASAAEDLLADVVVDASGQRTFLAKHGVCGPVRRGRYDQQVALFSQLEGVGPGARIEPGDTAIYLADKSYWSWMIPLSDEVTSVGVVANRDRFGSRPAAHGDFFDREALAINPAMTERLRCARRSEKIRVASSYSYRVDRFAGPGFVCVGDSHRFIDPIFSFGVSFALHEAEFAAEAISTRLAGTAAAGEAAFEDYQRVADSGQDIIADMLACFWDKPLAFSAFVHRRYVEDVIDTFAGRIYGEGAQQRGLTLALRELFADEDAQETTVG